MLPYRYAGFWIRLLAVILDSLLLIPLLLIPLIYIYGFSYFLDTRLLKGVWDGLIQLCLPLLLTVALWKYFGATPGKMLLGLKVVDKESKGSMSLQQSLVRYVSYIPSMLVFFLGFIWVAFDSHKQAWHDKWADTVVIYKQPSE